MTQHALDDLRVLDVSTSMSGAWCSRLFADFGADVIAIEPPEGSPLRSLEPRDTSGTSIPAAYVLANKRSGVLDPRAEDDRERLRRLAVDCDVIVESAEGGSLEAWGLDYEELQAAVSGLAVVAITPHGLTGGRAGRPGNDLTAWAQSGWASINGLAARESLKGSGFVASYIAGVAAYGAAISAIVHRDRGGEGQRIDVAEAEALLEIFGPALLGAAFGGPRTRRARMDITGTSPAPVRDGYFAIRFPGNDRYRDSLIALGLIEEADDPRWESPAARGSEEFVELVQRKMLEWDRMDLFEALSTMRISGGPVLTMGELMGNEHLRARGYWVRPLDASEGPEYAGAPAILSRTPWSLRRRPPTPGEHSEEILANAEGTTTGGRDA